MNSYSSSSDAKTEYLLLFHGTGWFQKLSPEVCQTVVSDWMAWFGRLKEEGRLVNGQPLGSTGKLVSGRSRSVVDGPFAESKEAIGGYFLLRVGSEDEAVQIAQDCPGLDHGITVEVRPVIASCEVAQTMRPPVPETALA